MDLSIFRRRMTEPEEARFVGSLLSIGYGILTVISVGTIWFMAKVLLDHALVIGFFEWAAGLGPIAPLGFVGLVMAPILLFLYSVEILVKSLKMVLTGKPDKELS
jgi:hypothetical protein